MTTLGWYKTKVKYTGHVVSGGTPDSGNSDYWDGPVPWFTPVDLGKSADGSISRSARTISLAGVAAAGLEILPIGSVVVSTRAPIGSVGLLASDATINQGCKSILPKSGKLDSLFAYYRILAATEELQSRGLGTTFVELSTYALRNLEICLPSITEQQRISVMLNDQTRKIDHLISLRRRQMNLLAEQWAALIQQAVTAGPTTNVAEAVSPITWRLDVPAHWQVKRLKFVTPHVTVGIVVNPSSYYVDFGVPCLRSLNVEAGELIDRGLVFINEQSHQLLSKSAIYRDDIVAVRTGQPGTAAVVDDRFDNANCIDLIIIRRSHHFDSDYLQYLLNSGFVRTQFESGSDGAIQQHFNIQTAKNLVVLLPQKDEQQKIVNFIRTESDKINATMSAYARQIELLLEYRSTLIHEATTGQRAVAASITNIAEAA